LEAVKQILRIPRNHELKIKIPKDFPENETVEVILILNKRQDSFKQKIQELKEAVKDNRFMNDLREVSDDFNTVDSEGWPDEEV
jgi:mannitol/fructose-specific phosphotransferase system IIA component (Ntr-type)